jgi:hypothetical protein
MRRLELKIYSRDFDGGQRFVSKRRPGLYLLIIKVMKIDENKVCSHIYRSRLDMKE